MKKYIAEFIATYALVFCGTGAIIINQITNGGVGNLGIALSFGIIVMVMIFCVGNISGAHMNPAVTIAMFIKGNHSKKEILPYITAQAIGGILASVTLRLLFPESETLGETMPRDTITQSFILEFILTFFLVFTIHSVLRKDNKQLKPFAGFIVGGLITLEACFAGPISGASMNPIRSIAPALINFNFEHLWAYILAPILGSISATHTCKILD